LICMRCLLITTEIAITKLIKTASNSHIQNWNEKLYISSVTTSTIQTNARDTYRNFLIEAFSSKNKIPSKNHQNTPK
jgi:hypothetical protein